uniref:Centrosomal protein 152 n=1 Tax=Lates calcarifer TaxID=8187 RepID=A0A4W6CYQ9_LATCA
NLSKYCMMNFKGTTLLTDLPDDMLEDSRDSSSPELEYSTCSNKNTVGDKAVNQYKASYNPHHPAHQPKMFNSQAAHQGGQFDHLQREFLDSTQRESYKEQLAQLQILNKAQQRQIEDLERKLEDSRRNMRYLEHQFAIVKDEKEGLAVSLKESSRLVEEAKEREVQLQNKVKALEQQLQVLTERDHENMKKQRVAEAAVDSMKQQMLELCRSDTLSRAREQHDRDLAIIREQHEVALLTIEQKLDSTTQALNEHVCSFSRLREQVKQLERQREEEQLERARVINALTQGLEESQQQCAKLLQTSSVQEMSQLQIKLQQAQSAKALSENLNKVLQEDLADLKEQITLYESAVKHGVIALDLSSDWENPLSESCMDLGLKKVNRKNAHLSDSKLPKDEALRLLRVEMQRCLGSLKGKRQKISQLQEELQHCQSQVNELQTQLDEAKLSSSVRTAPLYQHTLHNIELPTKAFNTVLDKKNKELKQSEEKVRSANAELCTKMREMIQELDQEKQEAAESQGYVEGGTTKGMDFQLPQLPIHITSDLNVFLSMQMEKTWTQRLEEARREKHRETAEVTCQTDETEDSSVTITAEELDSRLSAQKKQLQLETEKVKRKAVEEARKQTQRELQEKHLEEMAKQVEGAVTRAYNRWIEDLTSLPEYQASLQTEKEKWEELQEKFLHVSLSSQVSQALREAEEQWHKKHKSQLEQQSSGEQRVEELQEEVATLQSQLEQVRREQAALLKAELAGARAAWNRDKQQEISIIQVRSEQVYHSKLQEQHKKLEQVLQQAREDAELQKKELLLQMESKLQETLRTREKEWRCRHAEKELTQKQQVRDELLAELQTGLAEVQAQLLRDPKTDQQGTENTRRTSGDTSERTITHIIQTSCKDIVSRAISQAKKDFFTSILCPHHGTVKTQQYCPLFPGSLSQRKEQVHCRKECAETSSKLQKKNQELQRHLEKACRQLQHTVREHKTAMQRLKEDMLRYLQESRERAAEMIRMEVQRERQDTARKMRRYYLTCLQELLEDGGKTTGAEKKIMNAASKLAAMAKVLETPIKSKSGKNYTLPSESLLYRLHYCGFFFSQNINVLLICVLYWQIARHDFREFGGLTPDASDLTIYNEIAKKTPHAQTSNFPSVKMSTHREPTPGSEAKKQQGVCSRPVFSELRQRQQDSGFDSPFYQHN